MNNGFTLAEVLVTLVIIGIIAALSIPGLLQSTEKTEMAARLKRIYSVLAQAQALFVADGNNMADMFNGTHPEDLTYFATKLNVAKNCLNTKGCFPDVVYKQLNGADYVNFNADTNNGHITLVDGTSLMLWSFDDCSQNEGSGYLAETCAKIVVDLNGFAPPNQWGRDTFRFYITKTNVTPGGNGDARDCTPVTGWGWGCAQKVLKEGAINY